MMKKKLLSAIVDFSVSFIILLILLFIFIYTKENFNNIQTGDLTISEIGNRLWLVLYSSFFYFLIKDVFGISLGKRIFKLKIVDHKSQDLPSKQQLILRNLVIYLLSFLTIIYLVEIIVMILNNGRRLGDLIGKTEVVSVLQKN